MKRVLVLALFVCTCACGVFAQAVDTTVCAVLKSPASFNGKIIKIKGTVVAGFDQFIVKDSSPCGLQVDGIWLSYPQGTKGKAGPAALLQIQPAHNFAGTYTAPTRTAVTLDKSKDFKTFDSLLSQVHNKGAGMCLGCTRYTVTATLVGRLDGVADATLQHDKAGKIVGFGGFGNANSYPARLVLQSVADVTPKEVDFSKSDAVTKGETATFAGSGDLYDPLVAAQKSVAGLAGSPAGVQAEKDVAVFGKPSEHTGAAILSGATNEAAAKDEAQGAKDSPDGVLYNVTFNLNRLEGEAQLRAIVHMGQHISDLRAPTPGNEDAPLFVLEYNAWSMTAAAAVGSGQKFLTMPGGVLLWNSAWPVADRTTIMDDALKTYLANEAALSR
ncbi:MAG TPA: hypothetical protein VFC37_19455 [Terracidiphilus sp.]|jgi:hypothetical protein|nr:hypothetical protein [Terracidiphilus sp.]